MKGKEKSASPFLICEIHSAVFLLLGIFIYILCNKVPFDLTLIRNYLPDFLWMMSFMFAVCPVYSKIFEKHFILIAAVICFLLSCAYEVLQYINAFGGTGDFWDTAVYFTADVISCIKIKNIYVRRKPT